MIKRLFDFAVSGISLLLSLPLFIVIAFFIKLDSEGAVFFRQERLGKNGKKFACYKFRTMFKDAELKGPKLAHGRDSRQTLFGRFLRRYYLDELPQLWNIFLGQMSFVGPRPEREYFHRKFSKKFSKWNERLKVVPGLTGLAQVKGKSSNEPEEKLKYDLQYIEEQSFMLDLKIFAKQVLILFRRFFQRIKIKLKKK